MEELKEIKQDVKEIKSDVGHIKETLAANTASLKTHMARTDLNERRIASVEKWMLGLLSSILLATLLRSFFQ